MFSEKVKKIIYRPSCYAWGSLYWVYYLHKWTNLHISVYLSLSLLLSSFNVIVFNRCPRSPWVRVLVSRTCCITFAMAPCDTPINLDISLCESPRFENWKISIGWDGITYPIPNLNGFTVEVWELVSNLITRFSGHVITYPCWDSS